MSDQQIDINIPNNETKPVPLEIPNQQSSSEINQQKNEPEHQENQNERDIQNLKNNDSSPKKENKEPQIEPILAPPLENNQTEMNTTNNNREENNEEFINSNNNIDDKNIQIIEIAKEKQLNNNSPMNKSPEKASVKEEQNFQHESEKKFKQNEDEPQQPDADPNRFVLSENEATQLLELQNYFEFHLKTKVIIGQSEDGWRVNFAGKSVTIPEMQEYVENIKNQQNKEMVMNQNMQINQQPSEINRNDNKIPPQHMMGNYQQNPQMNLMHQHHLHPDQLPMSEHHQQASRLQQNYSQQYNSQNYYNPNQLPHSSQQNQDNQRQSHMANISQEHQQQLNMQQLNHPMYYNQKEMNSNMYQNYINNPQMNYNPNTENYQQMYEMSKSVIIFR
jgi:hypothetical protein